jgi:hypothetical protein
MNSGVCPHLNFSAVFVEKTPYRQPLQLVHYKLITGSIHIKPDFTMVLEGKNRSVDYAKFNHAGCGMPRRVVTSRSTQC